MDSKMCTKCEKLLPIDSFLIRKDRGKHYSQCRKCQSARPKNTRMQNIYSRNWKIKNRDILKVRKKEYAKRDYEKHREAIRARQQAYFKTDHYKEVRRKKRLEWWEIWDIVLYKDQRYRVVGPSNSHGILISRLWLPPIRIPKKYLIRKLPTICLS